MSDIDTTTNTNGGMQRAPQPLAPPSPNDVLREIDETARKGRATLVSARDQIEAQRDDLTERIKLINAQIEQLDRIHGWTAKTAVAKGRKVTGSKVKR